MPPRRLPRPATKILSCGSGICRREHVSLYRAPDYIHGLGFGPDGRRLAVAYVGGTAILDGHDAKLLRALKEDSCAVNTAFSRDSRLLAVAYGAGWPGKGAGLRIWNVETGEPVGEFHPSSKQVYVAEKVEFVADGRALVALSPTTNEMRRWYLADTRGGGTILEVRRPNLIGTSPMCDVMATADAGGAIEVWTIMDAHRVWAAPSSGEVNRLQMSSDGKTLAVVDSDHSVRLWDTETGWTLGPPLPHPAAIADLTFTGDGKAMVSATSSGQLFRWNLPQPISGGARERTSVIERKLGMTSQSGELVLQSPEE